MGIGGEEQTASHGGDAELGTTVRFTAARESHRLYVQREGGQAELMVASAPTTIPDLIAGWNEKLAANEPADEQKRAKATALIGTLSGAASAANAEATKLVAQFENAARDPKHDLKPPDDSLLETSERTIAKTLDELFTIFGEDSRVANLAAIREGLPPQGLAQTGTVLESWKRTSSTRLRQSRSRGRRARYGSPRRSTPTASSPRRSSAQVRTTPSCSSTSSGGSTARVRTTRSSENTR